MNQEGDQLELVQPAGSTVKAKSKLQTVGPTLCVKGVEGGGGGGWGWITRDHEPR